MTSSLEMNFARNILSSLMSSCYSIITRPFMDPVDPEKDNLKHYNTVIKEPICLNQMKQKLDDCEYQDIKEFICDFRLMLFNCYRFFGCDSKLGKLATKLESMFEQKLILLPIDIRLKTSIDAILMDETQSEIIESGMLRRRCSDRSFSTDIRLVTPIKAMMDELEKFGTISTMFSDNTEFQHDPIQFLIEKLRRWQHKRRNQQLIRTFDQWFRATVAETDVAVLGSCAEFIQFVQFISVAFQGLGLDLMLEEHLKLSHITIEDLEFALLFPRTSRLLSAIVPLITTTSKNRQSIIKSGLVHYDRWNAEIRERVHHLYRQWHEKRLCDKPDSFVKRFSIDPVIFQVLGNRRPVTDKKQFHELSVFQRCHILLAMCCMSLRMQDTIHFGIDKSIDWEDHRVIVLGEIGPFEYVRFAGLGEFASFFIYRIRARQIDPDLAQYSVEPGSVILPIEKKRKRKEIIPNKFRRPLWFAAEMKKAKTKKPVVSSNKTKRKSKSIGQNGAESMNRVCSTRSRRSTVVSCGGDNKAMESDDGVPQSTTNGCDLISFIDTEIIDKIQETKTEEESSTIERKSSIDQDSNNHSHSHPHRNQNDYYYSERSPTSAAVTEKESVDQNIEDESAQRTEEEKEDEEEPEEQDGDDDDNDDIPEILSPESDDFQLVARDLSGVVAFIDETHQQIELRRSLNRNKSSGLVTGDGNLDDEIESYNKLLEKVLEIKIFFELNEPSRVEKCNQSRLALREEIEKHSSNQATSQPQLQSSSDTKSIPGGTGNGSVSASVENNNIDEADGDTITKLDDESNFSSNCSQSNDRYTSSTRAESESTSTQPPMLPSVAVITRRAAATAATTQQIDRNERFNRRQKRKLNSDYYEKEIEEDEEDQNHDVDDDDDEEFIPAKKQRKLENGRRQPATTHRAMSRPSPSVAMSPALAPRPPPTLTPLIQAAPADRTTSTSSGGPMVAGPQQIKKKVYRIFDDYFTEDLEPVQINADGTLVHLPRDLITRDRYELAGKMIATYKSRLNGVANSNGTNNNTNNSNVGTNKSITTSTTTTPPQSQPLQQQQSQQNGTAIPMVSSSSS